MTFDEMYDILSEYCGVDDEALDLAFAIGGKSEDTACDILYYYTGWYSFEGFLEEFEDC